MVRINGNAAPNVKAETIDPLAQESGVESVDVQARLDQLHEVLAQMNEMRDLYGEYFSEEMEIRFKQMEALMESQAASFEAFEAMGYLPGGEGSSSDGTGGSTAYDRDSLTQAPMGLDGNLKEFADGEYDPAIDGYGDVEGVYGVVDGAVIISASDAWAREVTGDPDATCLGVDGETVDGNLVLTGKFKLGDGTTVEKKYVILYGATAEYDLVVNMTQMENGAECDFSRVVRFDKKGRRQGAHFVGGAGDDKIVGTTGNDVISGFEGNDTLNGWFGDDIINGDSPTGVQNLDDGDDILIGGAGDDTIDGGGGWDITAESDKGEGITHVSPETIDDISGSTPGIGFASGSTEWTAVEGDGYIEITNDGNGIPGEIVLDTPVDADGTIYNHAQAEVRGNDIVITYAGEGPDGEMRTFKVILKDANSSMLTSNGVLNIVVNGSALDDVLDFGIETHVNVSITLKGHDGNDVIVGAINELTKLGLEGDLTQSDVNGGGNAVTNIVDNEGVIVDTGECESKYEANYDPTTGRIDITEKLTPPTDPEDGLWIVAPEGFDQAFAALADPNDPTCTTYYLVLVNPTTKERLVFEIDIAALGINYEDILVGHVTEELFATDTETTINEKYDGSIPLQPFSLAADAYGIDGGAGANMLIGATGSNFITNAYDHTLELDYEDEFEEDMDAELL